MELREAVEKAKIEVQDWALQVTSGEEVSTQFNLISYGDIVRRIITEFCENLGDQIVHTHWSEISEAPSDKFETLVEATKEKGMGGCWSWFAIGWVMGSPENQALPRKPETFLSVLSATSKEELKLLENTFSTEEFLRERFSKSLDNASFMISALFSRQGFDMTQNTVAKWVAITTSLVVFEAYELGTRARMLIEEDLTIAAIAEQFK